MPYIAAPPIRPRTVSADRPLEQQNIKPWSYNLERLLREREVRKDARSISRLIASKFGYNYPPCRRVQIYMDKVATNPAAREFLLIQLVEGTTLEAENLIPLFKPLELLQFKHRNYGYFTDVDEKCMSRLFNAGDRYLDSIAEVQKKVQQEIIGGARLAGDQKMWMRRLWVDVESRVEEYLYQKELLLDRYKGQKAGTRVPWGKIMTLVAVLSLATWVSSLAIDPEDMLVDHRDLSGLI